MNIKTQLYIDTFDPYDKILCHNDENKTNIDNWCSAKMESQGVIFKAEWKSKDPRNKKCLVYVYGFNESTAKAYLKTSQLNISSIEVVKYLNQEYIFVSGNSPFLDIFVYNSNFPSKFISK